MRRETKLNKYPLYVDTIRHKIGTRLPFPPPPPPPPPSLSEGFWIRPWRVDPNY